MEPHPDYTVMETDLLSRLAANHLFLSQIEPFRATILALRSRNPDLACSILQTVVSNGGRYDTILFSSNSSPALLTYVCTLELIQFNDPTSRIWSFDSNTLRLRAEFLLYVQIIISRVLECKNENSNLGQIELGIANSDEIGIGDNDLLEKVKELGINDFDECLSVLNKILELGFKRLRSDLIELDVKESEEEGTSGGSLEIDETEMMCLRGVILKNDVIFEALCENIAKQVRWIQENDGGGDGDSGLDVSPTVQEEDAKVFTLIQRCAQMVHLDAMKECLKDGDNDGAMLHIQFLRFDYGVEEADYRSPKERFVGNDSLC